MLESFPIAPTLSASDVERAKAWYADKLGLQPTIEMARRSHVPRRREAHGFGILPQPERRDQSRHFRGMDGR